VGDRAPLRISIGGDLPESLVENFLDYLRDSGAGTDYDGGLDHLFTGENEKLSHRERLEALLAECDAVIGSREYVTVCDGQANYGSFPELEEFCKANKLSYDKHNDSGGDYDAGNEYIRDGKHVLDTLSTNHGDEDYIAACRVVLARQALYEGNFTEAIRVLDEVVGRLWKLPPLPPFRVVP